MKASLPPNNIVNELILKGTNQSFDALITGEKKTDYSFTLLSATYRERTGLTLESSDFISFGLSDNMGHLTNAGRLFADQHIVYNSRIFCTRWNGLSKGSIFDDAIDDKEYEGNLIQLLQNGSLFILNNSKVRFEKKDFYREDKPDYSTRAVTEALVNALIHRDYIVMGAEVHIDMYDDRLEITSPGGMYGGKPIQERKLDEIESERRNPVIADLFHRMKFMERRGSGRTSHPPSHPPPSHPPSHGARKDTGLLLRAKKQEGNHGALRIQRQKELRKPVPRTPSNIRNP